jgi:hypothetical protein
MQLSRYTSIFFLSILWVVVCFAESIYGFNLADSLIAANKIFSVGPAKDGIPAIDNRRFVSADKADFLRDESPILGVNYRGIGKAYPINTLNWHEIDNDRFNLEKSVERGFIVQDIGFTVL